MTDTNGADIQSCGGSIGHLIDRSIRPEIHLGAAWLVEDSKLVTCAHLLVPYNEYKECLKIVLPASNEEFGVTKIKYHPDFDMDHARQLAVKSLKGPVPALPLQANNLAVITISSLLPELADKVKEDINEKLSVPVSRKEKGLSGSLSELDMALVLQTINNARKEGCLILADERNNPLGRIYCKNGSIARAVYKDLVNESAIYQLVYERLSGHFYFQSGKADTSEQEGGGSLPPSDMILIESARRLDEIPNLLLELGGEDTCYKHAYTDLDLSKLSEEVKVVAPTIWPLLNGKVKTGQLWKLAKLDDYTIFSCLVELKKSNQIHEAESIAITRPESPKPLETAPFLPLSPWDEIQCLTVDPVTGNSRPQKGHLLGALRPGDPLQMIHNLTLPPEAAGSPIFKEGKVIGMECGLLPPDPSLKNTMPQMHQLLWIESVNKCLGKPTVEHPLPATPDSPEQSAGEQAELTPGCLQVACIDCPKCGSSSLDSARFCKSCGTSLIQDYEVEETPGPRASTVAAAIVFLIITIAGAFWFFMKSPESQPTINATLADRKQIEVGVDKADLEEAKWVAQPADAVYHNGDLIRLTMKPESDSFIYVLYQGTSSDGAHLIWPDSEVNDIRYVKGSELTIPKETAVKSSSGKHVALQGMTISGAPGTETLYFILSQTPSNLFNNAEGVGDTFEVVDQIYKDIEAPDGVEVNPRDFGGDLFSSSNQTNDVDSVYITRLEMQHAK